MCSKIFEPQTVDERPYKTTAQPVLLLAKINFIVEDVSHVLIKSIKLHRINLR